MAKISNIKVGGKSYEVGDSVYDDLGITQQRFAELVSRDAYTPLLGSAPTSSTLTYVDTDASVNEFRIGQCCRVPDSKMRSGYAIYMLCSIKNNVATWSQVPEALIGDVTSHNHETQINEQLAEIIEHAVLNYGQFQTGMGVLPKNALVKLMDKRWLASEASGEAPLGIYTDNAGNRFTYNDEGYVIEGHINSSWEALDPSDFT